MHAPSCFTEGSERLTNCHPRSSSLIGQCSRRLESRAVKLPELSTAWLRPNGGANNMNHAVGIRISITTYLTQSNFLGNEAPKR